MLKVSEVIANEILERDRLFTRYRPPGNLVEIMHRSLQRQAILRNSCKKVVGKLLITTGH